MKRTYRLTELGKLNSKEVTMFILIFISGPISLLIFRNIYRAIAFIVLIGAVISLIIKMRKNMRSRNYPIYYSILLYMLFLSFVDIFVITVINNSIIYIYGFILPFFSYLYISGIILFYLINIIFIFGLKSMFPEEGEIEKKDYIISFKKLSKYIDLDKQKLYFSLTLINALIYMLFVIFIMLLFIKHINFVQIGIIEKFSIWVKKQDYFTLFNGISLFSLLIAIYTLTIPAQRKIIKEAKVKYIERYKEYY